jgi:hypothetical protein
MRKSRDRTKRQGQENKAGTGQVDRDRTERHGPNMLGKKKKELKGKLQGYMNRSGSGLHGLHSAGVQAFRVKGSNKMK